MIYHGEVQMYRRSNLFPVAASPHSYDHIYQAGIQAWSEYKDAQANYNVASDYPNAGDIAEKAKRVGKQKWQLAKTNIELAKDNGHSAAAVFFEKHFNSYDNIGNLQEVDNPFCFN